MRRDVDFAFMLHPITSADVYRKVPIAKLLPEVVMERIFTKVPPMVISNINGQHPSGRTVKGMFVACPLTSRMIMGMPEDFVIQKIIRTGKLAQQQGAKILGLGALTSVVGDGGRAIAAGLRIPVTSGNSYTVAMALESIEHAAELMGKNLVSCHVVVLGATGSIGQVCARIIARRTNRVSLVARDISKLDRLAHKLMFETGISAGIYDNPKAILKHADIIIAVSSSVDVLIEPEDLKPGAIVCDVARPRDVSVRVAQERNDVLVIEGGIVRVPGDIDFGFNFGFTAQTCYACMAETMILALTNKYESYSLGKELTVEQVEYIHRLGRELGFELGGFRSFERPITSEEIKLIKEKANSGQQQAN